MNTNSLTTNSKWLKTASDKLKAKDIDTARLDCLLLLEEVLEIPRIQLVSDTDIKLSSKQISKLDFLLGRRLNHEPVAYIRGHTEFYGRNFKVDKHVLIPRPESEAFITLVKKLEIRKAKVADIGSGSGCLGITLALELPKLKVDLYDVSNDAIVTANSNIKNFKLNLKCEKSDLLTDIDNSYDIYVTNLPYVPIDMNRSINLSFEPSIALFAGIDGMEIYRKFWHQTGNRTIKPKYILTESLYTQHSKMNKLASLIDYKQIDSLDLVQVYKRTI